MASSVTPPSTRLWFDGIVVAFVLAVAVLIAWSFSHPIIEQTRFLRTLPRATLDAPKKGPAIYKGRLFGPEGRQTPLGRKSAITWWWVDAGASKSRKTICFERQIEGLELRAEGKSMPYVALASASSLTLLSDERDFDWDDPLVVDLGSQAAAKPSALPAAATRCTGTNPTYVERWLSQGAEVEIVACHQDGKLRDCDAPLRSLVGLGTIVPHRIRRADHAFTPFLVVSAIATINLVAFLGLALYVRARTLNPLRPSKRQP